MQDSKVNFLEKYNKENVCLSFSDVSDCMIEFTRYPFSEVILHFGSTIKKRIPLRRSLEATS